MKLEVIKQYVDKYTRKIVPAGETVEADTERAEELIEAGVVKRATRAKTAPKKGEKAEAEEAAENE